LFSQNRICKLCGLSKNTFKNHKHKDDIFQEKYDNIKKFVQKVIVKNSSYGVKRIKTALLDDYSIQVGRDALARLLKLWGLQLRRKTQKHKPSIIQKILLSLANRTNLLIRTKVTKPFQAITSDFTEIYYNFGKSKAYLAIHKDAFGQEVYGYNLSENMEANLVLDSFYKAKKKIKKLLGKIPEKIILHQDQGSQYTGYEYVDNVLKSKFTLSYSTPGTPTENPGQESFFGRFKDENRDEMIEIKSLRELERFIKNKINYYNKLPNMVNHNV
jgi:putative transposase